MKTVPFPNKEDIEIAAATWVAKLDRGLNDAERHGIEEWIKASPMHSEVLLKCASMWDLLDVLAPISKLLPRDELLINNTSSVEFLNQQPELVNDTAVEGNVASGSHYKVWVVAASMVLAIGGFSVSLNPFSSTEVAAPQLSVNSSMPKIEVISYKTAVGELSSVTLADGSKLQINTNSEVRVIFSKAERTLELLRGEVYFDVAKNPDRPFVVNVGEEKVIAVGTAFSVGTNDGLNTEVVVTEGKVQVKRVSRDLEKSYDDVFLTPGQQFLLVDDKPQLLDDQDTEALLAWRNGMLVFQGESLAQAIKEIDRYTSLKLKIKDQEVADISVGGFFQAGDTEQLLLILEQNFGVASERIGNEVILYKASP